MFPYPAPDFFIVGVMMLGTSVIFFWHDRGNRASRALSVCLFAIGVRLFLSGAEQNPPGGPASWLVAAMISTLESIAIFSGVDWGKRIGQTGVKGSHAIAKWLFRSSQILVVIYWGLSIGYLIVAPEQATSDVVGVMRVRGYELAIFMPILGTSILLTGIAIVTLRVSGIDPAEIARLRALSIAGPFLLAALVFERSIVPLLLTVGLLIFLSGSVRYLVIQGQRGQFMRQFLSPEVARMVQLEGLDQALQRERRLLSVVICDLRGFTSYAREHSSDQVVTLLEHFYDVVGEVASRHGGTVKDHAGDGVLILVGAPIAMADHARRAVRLAVELMQLGQVVIHETAPELGLGVGVATGNTTVGAIRGAGRLEYVAVGNAVNLAARLCDRAEPGEILSDTRTLESLENEEGFHTEERKPEKLKGFPEPVAVRSLYAGTLPELETADRETRKRVRRITRQKKSRARKPD